MANFPWRWHGQYGAITDESDEEEKQKSESRSSATPQRTSTLAVLLITAIITLFIHGLFLWLELSGRSQHISKPVYSPKLKNLPCGNSTAEARARGCTWDSLSLSWLPTACPRDENDSFLEYRGPNSTWLYWRTKAGDDPMSDAEVSEIGAGNEFFTTRGTHLVHCTFTALRALKIMSRGERLDIASGAEQHLQHCLMYLLESTTDGVDNDKINAKAHMLFSGC